jgi:hypothetical protein
MRKFLCVGGLAMLLAVPTPAAADTLGTLVFDGWSSLTNGQTVTINGQGGIWAGEIDWTLQTATTSGELFRAFCVDLYDDALVGPSGQSGTLKTTASLNGANSSGVIQSGARAAWLVNTYGAGTSAASAAGLQIAIWEALYGPTFSWSASAAATGFASSYYASVLSADVSMSSATYFDAPNNVATGHGQDQVRIGTPEPAPILLLMFGFMTILGYQYRLKRSVVRA